MTDPFAIAISVLALSVSAVTAWLTLFRQGTVKMTQPTVIFFGPDTPPDHRRGPKSKVYLRTLLFATSKRGCIVEAMHVSIRRSESHQNFNIWVHGEKGNLVRGSGLFIGETGVSANHHFLLPEDGNPFSWLAGTYQLGVHAQLLGEKSSQLLFSQQLEVSKEHAAELAKTNAGLYFDWGPDSSKYLPYVDLPPKAADADLFFETLGRGLPNVRSKQSD